MTENKLQDKCRGSLVGGAIGDAFGYPVEFVNSFEIIRFKYGDEGVTEYDKSYPWLDEHLRHYKALFSDDTQMTLYTTEGLIESAKGGMPLISTIYNAYIAWYGHQIGIDGKPKCVMLQMLTTKHQIICEGHQIY